MDAQNVSVACELTRFAGSLQVVCGPVQPAACGFRFDWGLQEEGSYAQLPRAEIILHLNSASARPNGGAGLLMRIRGLDARELTERSSVHAPSEVTFTAWDSRVFHVVDPFGNGIRFWENNPPGVSKLAER